MDVAHELSESDLLQCSSLVLLVVRHLMVLGVDGSRLPVYMRLGWHVADDVGLPLVVLRGKVATRCLSFSRKQLHDHGFFFYHFVINCFNSTVKIIVSQGESEFWLFHLVSHFS